MNARDFINGNFKASQYIISNDGQALDIIESTSHEEAALAYVRKLRGPRARHHRLTGDPGLSGWFTAMERVQRGNAEISVGKKFHVGKV